VIVQGIKSNVRQITRWTLVGTYNMKDEGTSHQIDGNLSLVFRADIGEYRLVPGNVFIRPKRFAEAAQHSEIQLEAKGTESTPCDQGDSRVIWLGSGPFPSAEDEAPATTISILAVDTIPQTGALGLGFGMRDIDAFPLKVRVEPCDASPETFPLAPAPPGSVDGMPILFSWPTDDPAPGQTRIEFPLPAKVVEISSDWSVVGGEMTNDTKAILKWNSAAAEFPPAADAAR
jgi:hypothetical protein